MREFSPYDEGADPVPFSFDLSYNYYPPEYHRPGPTVRIHRLRDCEQASGPAVIRIPQAREPAPPVLRAARRSKAPSARSE